MEASKRKHRDYKSCPNCRKEVPRMLEHLRPCASNMTPQDHVRLNLEENDRVKYLTSKSVSLVELRERFPSTYLDIATVLIELKVPVFDRKVTEPRCSTERKVKHYTICDIQNMTTGTVIPRRDPPQTDIQNMTNGKVLPRSNPPQTDIQNMTTGTVIPRSDPPQTGPASHGMISEASEEHDQVNTDDGQKGSESLFVISSPETENRKRLSNISSTSDDIVRPVRRKRKATVLLSSDDEDTLPNSSPQKSKARNTNFEFKYKELNMFVPSNEQKHLIENLSCAKSVKQSFEARSRDTSYSKKNPVTSYMSLVLKIMKYLAPRNEIEHFSWVDLCNTQKVECLFTDLQRKIGLQASSIANWIKVLFHMIESAEGDVQFAINEPAHAAHLKVIKQKAQKLQRKNNQDLSAKQTEQKTNAAYTSIRKFEEEYISYYKTFEKMKALVKPLFEKAESDREINATELMRINVFFNFYSILIGNRPGVFQYMPLHIFDVADKNKQTLEDGSVYYFLATSQHKTSTTHTAYIYMEEQFWELMRTYRSKIRPQPAKGYGKYLFLNSCGKTVGSPSSDLSRVLQELGLPQITANGYRHCLETLAAKHLSSTEQQTIHGMLTHSQATAKRVYVHGNSSQIPHTTGLSLLRNILTKCAQNANTTVSSFLNNSPKQLESQARQPAPSIPSSSTTESPLRETHIKQPTPEPIPGASSVSPPSPSSSTSSDYNKPQNLTDIERMKILIQREFPEISSNSILPDAKAYKEAVKMHPELLLKTDRQSVRRFNDLLHHHQRQSLAEDIVGHFKRRVKTMTDIEGELVAYLVRTGIYNEKLKRMCLKKLQELKTEQLVKSRITIQDDLPKRKKGDMQTIERIREQNWPDIKVLKAGNKGLGVYAANDIEQNKLICDYHGELVGEREGWDRYHEYGDNYNNSYMYHFEIGQTKMWIDAVKGCQCHKVTRLKGRLLNHDRKNPNVYPKVEMILGKPHVLFYAKRAIAMGDELQFDYGTHTDKYSANHHWK